MPQRASSDLTTLQITICHVARSESATSLVANLPRRSRPRVARASHGCSKLQSSICIADLHCHHLQVHLGLYYLGSWNTDAAHTPHQSSAGPSAPRFVLPYPFLKARDSATFDELAMCDEEPSLLLAKLAIFLAARATRSGQHRYYPRLHEVTSPEPFAKRARCCRHGGNTLLRALILRSNSTDSLSPSSHCFVSYHQGIL